MDKYIDRFILQLNSEISDEVVTLSHKITALEKLQGTDNFKKLSDVHQNTIKHQIRIMGLYRDMLYWRLDDLDIDPDKIDYIAFGSTR